MSRSRVTESMKESICTFYSIGNSQRAIALMLGLEQRTVWSILKERNEPQRQCGRPTQYQCDESAFDIIASQEQAYFLGFLFADGCNSGHFINLRLQEKDADLIYRFASFLKTDIPIKYGVHKLNDKLYPYVQLCVSRIKLCNRLTELGCMPNKSMAIRFPEWLSPKLIPHFVRGYYDGDGSLIIKKSKNSNGCISEQGCISITSNRFFLEQLKEIIIIATGVNVRILHESSSKNPNVCALRIPGNRQVKRVLNWLYADATIFLIRKCERYALLLSICRGGVHGKG